MTTDDFVFAVNVTILQIASKCASGEFGLVVVFIHNHYCYSAVYRVE